MIGLIDSGGAMPNGRQHWDDAVQTMPRDRLLALQAQRLREAVRRAHDGSPFFRRRFAAAGAVPDDIKSPADLAALSPVRKDDLRASEAEHPPIGDYRCVGLRGAVRLATSTGTTGRPTITLWTAADLLVD